MKKVIIDGNIITSKEELHEHIAHELSFPEHYGGNLDALYDCLSEIIYPVHFVIESPELLEKELGQYAVNLALVLHDVQSINKNITFDITCTES